MKTLPRFRSFRIGFCALGIATTALVACSEAVSTPLESPSDVYAADGTPPPPAKVDTKDGFVSFALPAKLTEASDSLVRIHAIGSLQGKNVGVNVDVTHRFITLRSTNAESDALLEAIARAYEVTSPTPHFRHEIQLPIEITEGNLASAARSRVRMRVTIDTGLKSEFAQIGIGFDPTRNALEIVELDPSFRTNVVRALSE